MITTDKIILDPCCGGKMMWFDKNNPLVIFGDKRDEKHELCDGITLVINPDIIMDFTNMPFADKSFKLISWDPPHMKKLGANTWMAKKYGVLSYHWRDDIRDGFIECFRVLQDYGVLVFKWNEAQVKLNDVIDLAPRRPLFGHTSGKHGKTIWLTFMKMPI